MKVISQEKIDRAIDVLVYRLRQKGLTSILELSAELVAADRGRDFEVSYEDLEYIFKTLKLDITKHELESIAYYLDKRGNIDYALLIKELTCDFTPIR